MCGGVCGWYVGVGCVGRVCGEGCVRVGVGWDVWGWAGVGCVGTCFVVHYLTHMFVCALYPLSIS